MQNLLDTHMSVVGLKQITAPVDILDRDGVERELQMMGSPRAKADMIYSKLTKRISERRVQNPIYYDSFSKMIKEALIGHTLFTVAMWLIWETINALPAGFGLI